SSGVRMEPDGTGRAYVRWAPPGTGDKGFSLRLYVKYDGSGWTDNPFNFLSVAAPGGAYPWRIMRAGPAPGVPGQMRIVASNGDVIGTSGSRALPQGDWRRVEVRWGADGILVEVFNRFEELGFSFTADFPPVPHVALVVGHWVNTPIPPPLNV